MLETDLWEGNLIPGDVLFLYGTIQNGDTMLDFGGNTLLQIENVTDWTTLAGLIDYI